MNARDRLIVALDVPKAEAARALVDTLAGHVGLFKVGSQAFTAAGPELVREIVARGERVFLDLKFHDIPNTVAGAVASTAQLGVSLATVHGLGGRAMLEAAVGALPAMGTKLLAITILTSHDEDTLGEIGVNGGVVDSVRRLALLAKEAGMDGVVASPHEVGLIREACGAGLPDRDARDPAGGCGERRPGARGHAGHGTRGRRRLPRRRPSDHRGRGPGGGRGRDRARDGARGALVPEPLGPGRPRVLVAQGEAPGGGALRVPGRLARERSRVEGLGPVGARARLDHRREGRAAIRGWPARSSASPRRQSSSFRRASSVPTRSIA